ncbi:hypothetical protein QBC37DRAFT_487289 [Rhypophila decipiens]|uniref:Uncharacterized protein n=1 Tax=Rhypophila decipiens TaxID=261697 RepID=A0AAN6Y054_9PEZI|nr:hypothetical protein QBC37DRAFT_487289 [Rhypophila decipiens]
MPRGEWVAEVPQTADRGPDQAEADRGRFGHCLMLTSLKWWSLLLLPGAGPLFPARLFAFSRFRGGMGRLDLGGRHKLAVVDGRKKSQEQKEVQLYRIPPSSEERPGIKDMSVLVRIKHATSPMGHFVGPKTGALITAAGISKQLIPPMAQAAGYAAAMRLHQNYPYAYLDCQLFGLYPFQRNNININIERLKSMLGRMENPVPGASWSMETQINARCRHYNKREGAVRERQASRAVSETCQILPRLPDPISDMGWLDNGKERAYRKPTVRHPDYGVVMSGNSIDLGWDWDLNNTINYMRDGPI